MSEGLPKYMMLAEDSDELRDQRISTSVSYNDQGEKQYHKRVTNTLPFKETLCDGGIHNIEYSSVYQVLMLATEKEVVVKTLKTLDRDISKGEYGAPDCLIACSGAVLLSPSEEVVAVCSRKEVQLLHTSQILSGVQSAPIGYQIECDYFLWVSQEHLICWKFEGEAVLIHIDSVNLTSCSKKNLPDVTKCTGASLVEGRLYVMQGLLVKHFDYLSPDLPVIIQHSFQSIQHDSLFFEYSCIISIFKVNIHSPGPSVDDIFGFVMVYYDGDEEQPDMRYLTFLKGDLTTQDQHEFRGDQMFYTTKEDRALYYDGEEKIPFGVKKVETSGFICLMVERSEIVYVIDPQESFDRLNIFAMDSKQELKDKAGKFFRGMTLMKSMLPIEREAPENAGKLTAEVTKQFKGEFMSLYFKDKETNLTMQFPASILAVTDELLYRRYAISTIDGVEKDKDEEILAQISKIKHSTHILEENKVKELEQSTPKPAEKVQREAEKQEVKPQPKKEHNESEKRKEQPTKIPIEEQAAKQQVQKKKEQAVQPSLFGQSYDKEPLSRPAEGLFSNAKPKSEKTQGADPTVEKKQSTTLPKAEAIVDSLGKKKQTGIFGGSSGGIFGNIKPNPSPSPIGAGFFGAAVSNKPAGTLNDPPNAGMFNQKPLVSADKDPTIVKTDKHNKQSVTPIASIPLFPGKPSQLTEKDELYQKKDDLFTKIPDKIKQQAMPNQWKNPFQDKKNAPILPKSDQQPAKPQQKSAPKDQKTPEQKTIESFESQVKDLSGSVNKFKIDSSWGSFKNIKQFSDNQLTYLENLDYKIFGQPFDDLCREIDIMLKTLAEYSQIFEPEGARGKSIDELIESAEDSRGLLERMVHFVQCLTRKKKAGKSRVQGDQVYAGVTRVHQEQEQSLQSLQTEIELLWIQTQNCAENHKVKKSHISERPRGKGKRFVFDKSLEEEPKSQIKPKMHGFSSALKSGGSFLKASSSSVINNKLKVHTIELNQVSRTPIIQLSPLDQPRKPPAPAPPRKPDPPAASAQQIPNKTMTSSFRDRIPQQKVTVPVIEKEEKPSVEIADGHSELVHEEQSNQQESDTEELVPPVAVRQVSFIQPKDAPPKTPTNKPTPSSDQKPKPEPVPTKPMAHSFGSGQPPSLLAGVVKPKKEQEEATKEDKKEPKKEAEKKEEEKKQPQKSIFNFGGGGKSAFSLAGSQTAKTVEDKPKTDDKEVKKVDGEKQTSVSQSKPGQQAQKGKEETAKKSEGASLFSFGASPNPSAGGMFSGGKPSGMSAGLFGSSSTEPKKQEDKGKEKADASDAVKGLASLSVSEKKPEQVVPKKTEEASGDKDKPKQSPSLFGNVDVAPASKPEEGKKEEKKEQKKEQKPQPILFGATGPSLFGGQTLNKEQPKKEEKKQQPDQKPKQEPPKEPEAKKQPEKGGIFGGATGAKPANNLFGPPSDDKKAPAVDIFGKPAKKEEGVSTAPKAAQTATLSLGAPVAPPPQQPNQGMGGFKAFESTNAQFGGGSKFMMGEAPKQAQPQQPATSQSSSMFDPNAVSFGGMSSAGTTSTQQTSFASALSGGGNQGNIFGNKNPPPSSFDRPAGFGGLGVGGNTMFGAGQTGSMFGGGGNQGATNMLGGVQQAGQQNSQPIFGGGGQSQGQASQGLGFGNVNTGGNFLGGGGNSTPPPPQTSGNAHLYQMRK